MGYCRALVSSLIALDSLGLFSRERRWLLICGKKGLKLCLVSPAKKVSPSQWTLKSIIVTKVKERDAIVLASAAVTLKEGQPKAKL